MGMPTFCKCIILCESLILNQIAALRRFGSKSIRQITHMLRNAGTIRMMSTTPNIRIIGRSIFTLALSPSLRTAILCWSMERTASCSSSAVRPFDPFFRF